MILNIMVGVIALMAVTLIALLVVYGFLVAGKRKAAAAPAVAQPPVVGGQALSHRQQVVEDKLAEIVAAYRDAEAAKFRADAIEEVKALLK